MPETLRSSDADRPDRPTGPAGPTADAAIRSAAEELCRQLPGRVVTGGRAMRRFTRDFGAARRAVPGVVVRARQESDVVAALKVARAHRLPVTLRGRGCSVNGQTLSRGGLVIANAGLGEPPRLSDGGRVEVSARSRWREVERFLNRRGRRVPVLADYLGLTVGGALAVGTYGADGIAHGALVDQVERLRLVRPDGTATWCSATESPELFRFGLAGMGQVGVIEKAVLATVPDPRFTTLWNYHHRSLPELVDAYAWMARGEQPGPELWKGLVSRGRCVSTCGVGSPTLGEARSAAPPAAMGRPSRRLIVPRYRFWRHLTVSLWVSRFALAQHLWFDYLFDFEGLKEFAGLVSELLARDAFAGCLKSIYLVATRRQAGAPRLPFEAAGWPESNGGGQVKLGIGFYNMVPKGDAEAHRRVDAAAELCLDRCLDLGGRPYLYGWHRLDGATLERLYGDDLRRLRALRQELDPDGLFQPAGPLAGLAE